MNTEGKFGGEKDMKHWARTMFVQHHQQATALRSLIPPSPPPTRMQRLARKIRDARMRLGSWIAGVELDDY